MKKSELIKLAEYLNIINILIERYSFSSLFKVEMTALIIYMQCITGMEVRKVVYNKLNKFFYNLNSILLSNYSDFNYISCALKINEKKGYITIDGDCIKKNVSLKIADVEIKQYMYKENIVEILNEINSMTINSFVQEVISNV